MNYHKLKQNKFNKNHKWNGITYFCKLSCFFLFSSLCLLYCYSLQFVIKMGMSFKDRYTKIEKVNDHAFLCIDMWYN